MATSYTQLKAGDRIGKCEIVRLLGKGGMGAVYLARHTTLDILVAVKTLAPDSISEDKREANRFIREARLAAQIRHPNVVAIMDADMDEENGLYYIVMEYVDGGNLAEYLQGEPLDPEWVFSVIYQISEALQEASRFGIVHRDIKPHNIMVNDQGVAKLADLGLAKSVGHDSVSLTVMGSALGTPAYMSPQQAADAKSADGRDDIYSLGATLYECLTGKPPFDGESVYSVITKVVTKTPADPRRVVPDAPTTLVALCGKMMARERDKRYANAEELMADLNVIRNEGLESVESMSAASFLEWPGASTGVDPNAPTEILDPEEMRAVAAQGMAAAPTAPELTQQVVVPGARQPLAPGQQLATMPSTEELSAHTVPGQPPKKTKWPLIGAGVVVLTLLIGGSLLWMNLTAPEPAPTAAAPAPPEKPVPAPTPAAPGYGLIHIETMPAGATATLDGQEPQPTPATFRQVSVGMHNLKIEKEGYETLFEKVTVEKGEVTRPSPIRLLQKEGTMVINTQPSEATITLPSGERQMSPYIFKNMPVGVYELVISKEGYATQTVPVEVQHNEMASPPVIKLVAETGEINLSSEPPGAEVVIQGAEGIAPDVTPTLISKIAAGKRIVQLKLAGYEPEELEVEVKPGATTTVPVVKLKALTGSLRIEPNMRESEFELFAAGEETPITTGKTPTTVDDLAAGTYRLLVTHESDLPDYPLKKEVQVTIKAGEEKTVKPKIPYGAVSFQATPSKTMVLFNNRRIDPVPFSLSKVPLGELSVSFHKHGYGEVTRSGTVKAGETLQLKASLKRSNEDTSRGRKTFTRPPGPPPHGPGDRPTPPHMR